MATKQQPSGNEPDAIWQALMEVHQDTTLDKMGETLDATMAKRSGTSHLSRKAGAGKGGAGGKSGVALRSGTTGRFMTAHNSQVEAVMAAAERSGLLHEKSGRIGGRVSPTLVEQAKARTGIETDTDLIEFALASVALEDRFAETFKAIRGKVDPDLKLGF